ncbi:MAG: hypothetical protein KGL39_27715 [Patescibacteria group bacterium]|nr:hypothetical protein [Patescibacteria group bacterium]
MTTTPVPRYATTAAGVERMNRSPDDDIGQALIGLDAPAQTHDEFREKLLETSVQYPGEPGAIQHAHIAEFLQPLLSLLLANGWITEVLPHA